jgi:hypothetical protein
MASGFGGQPGIYASTGMILSTGPAKVSPSGKDAARTAACPYCNHQAGFGSLLIYLKKSLLPFLLIEPFTRITSA